MIVLAGPGYYPQQQGHSQSTMNRMLLQEPPDAGYEPHQERRFKVVGEREEWIEEW